MFGSTFLFLVVVVVVPESAAEVGGALLLFPADGIVVSRIVSESFVSRDACVGSGARMASCFGYPKRSRKEKSDRLRSWCDLSAFLLLVSLLRRSVCLCVVAHLATVSELLQVPLFGTSLLTHAVLERRCPGRNRNSQCLIFVA